MINNNNIMPVQSVIFKKSKWSLKNAKSWLTSHHYKLKHRGKPVDVKPLTYRFRQKDPSMFKRMVTKKLPNGISFIIGYK